QAYACYYAAVLYALRGEPDLAKTQAERCLDLSESHGFRQWHGLARAIKGICTTRPDESSGALDDVKATVEEYRSAGYQLGITALYVLLCPVLMLRQQQQFEEALEILERGLSIVRDNSERIFASELLRLKAQALRQASIPGTQDQPESLLESALATAREQRAKSLELRAARDLAEIWMAQGKRAEARGVLAPICAWFKEGEATRDLGEARRLL